MAWLRNEEAAAKLVRELLDQAERKERRLSMSIVNLGEVFYLNVKSVNLAQGERVVKALRARVHIASAADEVVMIAATLKSRHAISYADAFAAATAIRMKAPLVTGDPEFRAMADQEEEFRLEWIGGHAEAGLRKP